MPNSTARLLLIGDISDHTSLQLGIELASLAESGAEKLVVWIASHGGDVDPGVFINNRLADCGLPVTTVNLGEVSSVAVPIFSAGQTRLAMPLSYYYLHDLFHEKLPGELCAGDAHYILEGVIKRNRWIAAPTAAAMGKEIDYVCDLMTRNTHMLSEAAVSEGLATALLEEPLVDQVESLSGGWLRTFSHGSKVEFSDAQLDAATSEEAVWIKFEDGLTYYAVAQLVDVVVRAMARGVTKFAFYLPASSKNSFHAALCAYNTLASFPIEVQIFADGPIGKTGVIFLQAGTSRCVPAGTPFSITWHAREFLQHGWLSERDLRYIRDDLSVRDDILTALLLHSGKCEEGDLRRRRNLSEVASTEQALDFEWITGTFALLPAPFGERAITLVATPPELPATVRHLLF